MYVNTNVAALNAWQNLYNTQQSMTNTLEQLSSGYRINTAANDPAGLAISQQMQAQIGGLNQAYQNSQSGISLLQTADGALGQIQNILQSMRSLASEAATATMNTTDAQNLQVEMNQYAQEITQITNTTQFNNINLLGGAFQNQNIQVGANQGQSLSISMGAADAYTLGVTGEGASVSADTLGITNQGTVSAAGIAQGNGSLNWASNTWGLTVGGTYTDLSSVAGSYNSSSTNQYNFTVTSLTGGSGSAVTGGTVSVTTNGGQAQTYAISSTGTFTVDGLTYTLGTATTNGATFSATVSPQSTTYTFTPASGSTLTTSVQGQVTSGTSLTVENSAQTAALSFTTGSDVPSTNQSVTIASGTTSYGGTAVTAPATPATIDVTAGGSAGSGQNGVLTTQAQAYGGIAITSQGLAQIAITTIDNAINTLSTERANVGAYQNRLNFASSDAQAAAQNLTAARGTIMNADMAQQMSVLAQEQVLQQSGVAMLAQANAVPQALLKLLP